MSRFEQVRATHPNDPIATAYLLNCVLFHELYRLDLLDTTFYANDGFLSGKHPVTEDPKVRDQINGLADIAIARPTRNTRHILTISTHCLFADGRGA